MEMQQFLWTCDLAIERPGITHICIAVGNKSRVNFLPSGEQDIVDTAKLTDICSTIFATESVMVSSMTGSNEAPTLSFGTCEDCIYSKTDCKLFIGLASSSCCAHRDFRGCDPDPRYSKLGTSCLTPTQWYET